MKALAEDQDELCSWFESRVEQVLGAVQAHQQMVRDMERREEVAIEKDEMNATRRRLLDDDGASVGGASRDSLADASAHSGRPGRGGGAGAGADGEANVRASIDELAATIKALDVQIRERRRGRRGGGGADDGLSVDGRGSVGSLASMGSAGSASSQNREKGARRQSRLREELKGLEGQRQRALNVKQELEEKVRAERALGKPSESQRKSEWESQRREELAEIDDKIEALQTEIDYKDTEIRKNKDNLNQVSNGAVRCPPACIRVESMHPNVDDPPPSTLHNLGFIIFSPPVHGFRVVYDSDDGQPGRGRHVGRPGRVGSDCVGGGRASGGSEFKIVSVSASVTSQPIPTHPLQLHHGPNPATAPTFPILVPSDPHLLSHPTIYPTPPYRRLVPWRTRPHVRWRVYCWITWR